MLSPEDYLVIKTLKKRGVYLKDIAAELGVHPKTVSRALQREGAPQRPEQKRASKVGTDKPISGTDVYRVVKATEARSGITFKPHDLRRTFITEALATGTPLATVQAAAGHARGETTLRYAQAVDARRARRELKLRYG